MGEKKRRTAALELARLLTGSARELAWDECVERAVTARRAVVVDWRGLPEEVAKDLGGMRRGLRETAKRCLSGEEESASAFLSRVSKVLAAEGLVLARIDPRPSDTAVVIVLDREKFLKAAKLARDAAVGRVIAWSAEPLAVPTRGKPARRRTSTRGTRASVARGRELDALRLVLRKLCTSADKKLGVKEQRSAVQALRFGGDPKRGRAEFAEISETDQRLLRALVVRQLESKDVPALVSAIDAARVVGDRSWMPKLEALKQHPTPLVGQHAARALTHLRGR